jgi:hypothetical protein
MPDHRRRTRRRAFLVVLIGGLALLVVVGLVTASLSQVNKSSGPYEATINQSFGTQASLVAASSQQTGVQMRQLLAVVKTEQRAQLQQQLDALATDAAQQAQDAAALATPATTPPVGAAFATVMADRAKAMAQIRSAIEGALGMTQLGLAGATKAPPASAAVLPSSLAAQRLADAGGMLAQSDRSYDALRRTLRAGPGGVRLPASAWGGSWSVQSMQDFVTLVTTTPALRVANHLVLQTIGLTPEAIPSPGAQRPAGTSVLPPTYEVDVTPVLRNGGDVNEDNVAITAILTPTGGGDTVTLTRSVSLLPNHSAAVRLALAVYPGTTYRLQIAIGLPPAPVARTNPSATFTLQIAQAAPLVPGAA